MDGRNPNHQLIGGKHPIIYRVSTIRLVVQDFFHQQYFYKWDPNFLGTGVMRAGHQSDRDFAGCGESETLSLKQSGDR